MKKITTVEIIVESEELFVIRSSGEQLRGRCEQCGQEIRLVVPRALPPHEAQEQNEESGKSEPPATVDGSDL
jgi:hypothetical protein